MSKIASLKSIDIQKWATVTILDAIGIDIDPEDGHIYFADAPDISIDINDRVLRVELGKPIKGIDYSIYNPLTRVEHAQYLMTLAIYAQVIDQMIGPDEAKLADFSIETELEMVDEFGKPVSAPINVAYITRGDGKTKNKGPEGVGRHIDQSVAISIAVMDWLNKVGYLPEQTYLDVIKACHESWEEGARLQDLTGKDRRKETRLKKTSLIAPDEDDDSEDFMDGEYEPPVDPDEVFFENDETSDITFSQTDFSTDYNPSQDNDWEDSDFDLNELKELFGDSIEYRQDDYSEDEAVSDNESIDFFEDSINSYHKPEVSNPVKSANSFDDIDFISDERVGLDEIPVQPPVNQYDPMWMNGNMNQNFGMMNGVSFDNMTPIGVPVQQNYDITGLPGLKIEDLLTDDELKKVKERESSEESESINRLSENDFSSGSRMNMNALAYGIVGGYIPQ